MQAIENELNELAELRASIQKASEEQSVLVQSVIPQHVKERISEINAEYAPRIADATARAAVLESQIRLNVMGVGQTVRGERLMAVYNHARVTWETKSLEAMAKFVPEILDYRLEGNPSVTIRERKGESK